MVHIADFNTGEDYITFDTEKEALEWAKENCEICYNSEDNGKGIYYIGNRIEIYSKNIALY